MGLWSTRVLPFLLFLLLRQRERWRSIVMNTSVCAYVCVSVCLSVCLSASLSPESHARSLPIFVHVAYGRGSVLLRQGDEISRGRGNFGGFLPHLQCIVQHDIWDPYKNGWTDRDAVLLKTRVGPRNHACIRSGCRFPKKMGQFSRIVWAIQNCANYGLQTWRASMSQTVTVVCYNFMPSGEQELRQFIGSSRLIKYVACRRVYRAFRATMRNDSA